MSAATYGPIKAERAAVDQKDLLIVPHKGKPLTVSLEPFGPGFYLWYAQDIMRHHYKDPRGGSTQFRPATTAETASILDYKVKEGYYEDFDGKQIILGRAQTTTKGIYFNPPTDHWNEVRANEETLEAHLEEAKEQDGLWIVPNGKIEGVRDFSFMPYEEDKGRTKDKETFLRSRLARGIEHTTEEQANTFQELAEIFTAGTNLYGTKKERTNEGKPTTENVTLRVMHRQGEGNFLSIGLMPAGILQGYVYGIALNQ